MALAGGSWSRANRNHDAQHGFAIYIFEREVSFVSLGVNGDGVGIWANVRVPELCQPAVIGFENGYAARFARDIKQMEFTVESQDIRAPADWKNVFLLVGTQIEKDQLVIVLA